MTHTDLEVIKLYHVAERERERERETVIAGSLPYRITILQS